MSLMKLDEGGTRSIARRDDEGENEQTTSEDKTFDQAVTCTCNPEAGGKAVRKPVTMAESRF